MNRIYFVRHGENMANLTKEMSYKKVDYPLTDKGFLQSQQTADYLAALPVQAVYSSPLKRAAQTASMIAARTGLTIQIEEDLREVNVGRLEGQPVTARLWEEHNAVIYAWIAGQPQISFPDGENQYQLARRFSKVLQRILMEGSDRQVVVVGHGGLFTFGLPMACPGPMSDRIYDIPNHNCSISTLDLSWEGDHFEGHLHNWAYVGHLSGAAADFVHGYPLAGELENQ